MFGYVTITGDTLPKEARERYRAFYCGLCRALRREYGNLGRATLSYDATFLWLLLSSLYEPEERSGRERCVLHPVKPHPYVDNDLAAYCADMNMALAYHKCLDNWQDEKSLVGKAEAALLKPAYDQIAARYPDKCGLLESSLREIRQAESEDGLDPDRLANLTGKMLGALYRCREDEWADTLQRMGEALGRFIYLMDAYDDLPGDLKRKRFNPLKDMAEREDYEEFCKESLTLLIAECTQEFETLPLLQDVEILRNILYAGCWMRYRVRQAKRDREKPAVKENAHG